ncbi:MAG: energy-coupling factor transporter transmembrane protein EcfT [Actinobacteria bacterium]|nr:MAG: energy-coupling factor transporter transmembrane protein EcfT [Actinomycetota bacterium]
MSRTRACRERGFLQTLDARVTMLHSGILTVLAFVLSHPLHLATLVVSTGVLIVTGGLAQRARGYVLAGTFMAAAVCIINPLLSRQGATIILRGPVLPVAGRFVMTAEAIAYGGGMALRLLCVVAAFALYSSAVDPDAATSLLSRLSFGSALVIALAVRLFPAIIADASRITDAQRSRGARLDGGGRRARIAARAPIIDCLLLTSMERSVQIAESMESRGFASKSRTPARPAPRQRRDVLVGSASTLALVLGIAVGAGGLSSLNYYPVLSGTPLASAALAAAPLGVVLLAPSLLSRGWTGSHWLRSRI